MGGRENARARTHFKAGFETFTHLVRSTLPLSRCFLDFKGLLGENSDTLSRTILSAGAVENVVRHLRGRLRMDRA